MPEKNKNPAAQSQMAELQWVSSFDDRLLFIGGIGDRNKGLSITIRWPAARMRTQYEFLDHVFNNAGDNYLGTLFIGIGITPALYLLRGPDVNCEAVHDVADVRRRITRELVVGGRPASMECGHNGASNGGN